MNNHRTTWFALSCLLLGQATCAVTSSHAGSYDVKDTTSGKDIGKDVNLGEGNFGRQKFTVTLDTRFGYDDNASGRPDSVLVPITAIDPATGFVVGTGKTREVNVDQDDSFFVNFSLGVGYTAASPRLTLTVGADVGVTYYFDRDGRDYDINGGLSGRLTYKLTPRAFLDVSTYNAFISAGDYGASNLSGFTGTTGTNAGIPGSTDANRDSDYFYTTDRLALSYQFAPRLTATVSQSIVAFAYDESLYADAQDRIESYTGLELGYLLQPNLSLSANYRFGYIDYFNVSNDSMTHFVLGGVDYSFSQRLKATVRAGAEFREYFDTVGDETSPYAEAAVTYDISKNSHLALNARYGIEEGVLYTTGNSKSDTFRAGIDYTQNFTARISGYLAFYYSHNHYETLTQQNIPILPVFVGGPTFVSASRLNNFDENSYDVSLGFRYAINRHLAAEVGYTHTTFDSQVSEFTDRSYERNRYFGGLRISF